MVNLLLNGKNMENYIEWKKLNLNLPKCAWFQVIIPTYVQAE